jgi:hypothetical protein
MNRFGRIPLFSLSPALRKGGKTAMPVFPTRLFEEIDS